MCSKRHCIRRPEAWEGDDRKDDGGAIRKGRPYPLLGVRIGIIDRQRFGDGSGVEFLIR